MILWIIFLCYSCQKATQNMTLKSAVCIYKAKKLSLHDQLFENKTLKNSFSRTEIRKTGQMENPLPQLIQPLQPPPALIQVQLCAPTKARILLSTSRAALQRAIVCNPLTTIVKLTKLGTSPPVTIILAWALNSQVPGTRVILDVEKLTFNSQLCYY